MKNGIPQSRCILSDGRIPGVHDPELNYKPVVPHQTNITWLPEGSSAETKLLFCSRSPDHLSIVTPKHNNHEKTQLLFSVPF